MSRRLTESGDARLTEAGDARLTEAAAPSQPAGYLTIAVEGMGTLTIAVAAS
jgi:hypothetical protein